jgi:drug/metabolite transporter (DMT)-like permease
MNNIAKKIVYLILFIISLGLTIGACVKFFIFHEVPFKAFIIGLLFSLVLSMVFFCAYKDGISTINNIISRNSPTRGDFALYLCSIFFGFFGVYQALFENSNKLFYGISGLLFLGAGLWQLLEYKYKKKGRIPDTHRNLN